MPAVSKKQAIAANIAKAVQQGKTTAKAGSPSAQMAASMSPESVGHFAGTPQQGLPMKKKQTRMRKVHVDDSVKKVSFKE